VFTISSTKTNPGTKKCATFATLELKSVAEEVLKELKTDPATSQIASEVVKTPPGSEPLSLFNTRVAQITLIKNRQLHDYLKVCSIRLQTNEDQQTTNTSQKRAEDQLCILKAILSV
jgi:hypothetical protein